MPKKIMFESVKEMPPMAISLSSMDWNKTGSWRYMRPVYQYKTAPCVPTCPAGEKIPRYLREFAGGDIDKAWTTIIKDTPFPSVCGRICRYPCEVSCNRRRFDQPIAIRALEKHIGDFGRANGKFDPVILDKDKKVAVVGAGVAGLTAAFFLRLEGYKVDVFEAMDKPGGILRYRVPAFRLPDDVLDDEIGLITKIGVNIKTGVRIGKDMDFEKLLAYDAVFVATGAWTEKKTGVEGEDLKGVQSSDKLLSEVKAGKKPSLGGTVAVIGSDDSALDAARTALRLGKKVILIADKSKNELTVPAEELTDAMIEGVELKLLTGVKRIIGKKGKVSQIECIEIAPGTPDSSGRRKAAPVEGSESLLDVESVVINVRREPVFDFLPESLTRGCRVPSPDGSGRTANEKVFVVGDATAEDPGSVSRAIGSGKNIASVIGLFLKNKPPKEMKSKREVVHYETLNMMYFRKAGRASRELVPVKQSLGSFDETVLPMDDSKAMKEADRCLSCGVCTECDNCLIFCPDVAISKLKKGYRIDYDYCKGCGICVHECPRNCMSLVEEMKWKK
jgi:NADPH-dependent glutamate synthase beta subunit-like oxidoreductase